MIMNVTAYVNQFLFPLALFGLVLFSFYAEPYLVKNNKISGKKPVGNNNYISELDRFYEVVIKDDNLMSKLESIIEEKNLIEQIIKLGNSLGYKFTLSDIEQSIADNTANSDSHYICLPIGCWQVS